MLTTKQKIKLARVVQVIVMGCRSLFGAGPITQVHRRGVRWELDLTEGIDFSIWLLGTFEPETVRCHQRIVRPGDTVLDIGANVGAHTLLLAQEVGPTGRVVAIEPTDYAVTKLRKNAALNPPLNARIHALQLMLGDTDDPRAPLPALYSSWPLKEEAGLHHLHQGRLMSTAGAHARTLDSVVAELGLTRVDCIKLDIDGAECAMLRGARRVLTQLRPTIIMELAPYVLEERGSNLPELVSLLREYGYVLQQAANDRPVARDAEEIHAAIPLGASLNVVARPADAASPAELKSALA